MTGRHEAEKGPAQGPKSMKQVQSNKLDWYTLPKGSPTDLRHTPKAVDELEGTTLDLTLQDIVAAINGVKSSLEHKMGTISIDVNLIQADLTKMNEKVKTLDIKTASLIDDVALLQREVQDLKSFCETAERKLDDREGRTRCNNVRILGVPEKAEGPAPDLFREDLILNYL